MLVVMFYDTKWHMITPNTEEQALELTNSYRAMGYKSFACTMEYLANCVGEVRRNDSIVGESGMFNKVQQLVWK